jgi:hypothetical protein
MRLYRYVGPKQIAERVGLRRGGVPICSADDVRKWQQESAQKLVGGCFTATFVVDAGGVLLVADRRSEHVACAGGEPIRSAGEITFEIGSAVEVGGVSNQSTGYCPEPESWPAVAESLSRAGLAAPQNFSLACVFRRCVACSNLNVVKDALFECGVCGAELPTNYNVQ